MTFSSKFDLDYLVETKKVNYKENIDFKFKALTAQNMFKILNKYPDFITLLFDFETFQDNNVNAVSEQLLTKYADACAMMLALCECSESEEEIEIKHKFFVFSNLPLTFQVAALKACFELTFGSDIGGNIKKLMDDFQTVLQMFFQSKVVK